MAILMNKERRKSNGKPDTPPASPRDARAARRETRAKVKEVGSRESQGLPARAWPKVDFSRNDTGRFGRYWDRGFAKADSLVQDARETWKGKMDAKGSPWTREGWGKIWDENAPVKLEDMDRVQRSNTDQVMDRYRAYKVDYKGDFDRRGYPPARRDWEAKRLFKKSGLIGEKQRAERAGLLWPLSKNKNPEYWKTHGGSSTIANYGDREPF